jgi:hypothetical protein
VKNIVSCNVVACNLEEMYQCFRGMCSKFFWNINAFQPHYMTVHPRNQQGEPQISLSLNRLMIKVDPCEHGNEHSRSMNGYVNTVLH